MLGRGAAVRLIIGFLLALAFWFLFSSTYEAAVAPAAEFLLRLGESPAMTRLETLPQKFLLKRSDFPPGVLEGVELPARDLHFNFVLLAAFFALRPRPWRTENVIRFLLGALCLYLVHVVFLIFQVRSAYATRFGPWSAAHYGSAARNFWAGGFHFYQIAGRFAAPFAIWWFLGRPQISEPIPSHPAPKKRKKRKS